MGGGGRCQGQNPGLPFCNVKETLAKKSFQFRPNTYCSDFLLYYRFRIMFLAELLVEQKGDTLKTLYM